MQERVRAAVEAGYGVVVDSVSRIHAGTASLNFEITDWVGRRLFAKVYRGGTDLSEARAAIELADFARSAAVPVPEVHRTVTGEVIGQHAGLSLSLWDFVPRAKTAQGRVRGARREAIGAMTGALHATLAAHPSGGPARRSAVELLDVEECERRYEQLIAAYEARRPSEEFELWALDAARERRSLLPRLGAVLERLPLVTVQVLHGDLASPNVLVRGDAVVGVIDFCPPRADYLAWEIARIACDPVTMQADSAWQETLALVLDAYRAANPGVREDDLAAVVAVGAAYTIGSTYPLAEPLKGQAPVDVGMQRFARARHEAAVTMLASLGR